MTRNVSRLSDKLIFVPLAFLAACSGEPEAADLPYGTAQQMMADEVQVAADIYWQAVRFESRLEEDGSVVEQDFRPQTDEEWAQVEAAAAKLVELAGELQSEGYAQGRGEDWMVYAQGLASVSKQAQQAAAAKDPDAVFATGGDVYNVCKACHQMYPPANTPEDEAGIRPEEGQELNEYLEGTSET